MSEKRSIRAVKEIWLLQVACVFVTTLCLIPCANAQTNGGTVLTLDEALLLAKSNNRDLKQFGLDVGKQREALSEAKTHLYPRFDTSVDVYKRQVSISYRRFDRSLDRIVHRCLASPT